MSVVPWHPHCWISVYYMPVTNENGCCFRSDKAMQVASLSFESKRNGFGFGSCDIPKSNRNRNEWKVHRSEDFYQYSDEWISHSLNFPKSNRKTIQGRWTKRLHYIITTPGTISSWSDAKREGVQQWYVYNAETISRKKFEIFEG